MPRPRASSLCSAPGSAQLEIGPQLLPKPAETHKTAKAQRRKGAKQWGPLWSALPPIWATLSTFRLIRLGRSL